MEQVIEGGETDGFRKGLSANYLSVKVPADSAEPGELLRAKIVALSKDGLVGELV